MTGVTTASDPSIAPIVKDLEHVFDKLNEKFFDSSLSKPVITLSEKGKSNAYGWFTIDRVWKDIAASEYFEINICPEYLHRPVDEVCGTMLHEMIHLHNALHGVQDCSRGTQYHNKKFRDAAETHGLHAEKSEPYGYVRTSLKQETVDFVKTLDLAAFDLFRQGPKSSDEAEDDTGAETDEPLKPSSTRRYRCPECGNIVRATKEVKIRCEDCDRLYVKQ